MVCECHAALPAADVVETVAVVSIGFHIVQQGQFSKLLNSQGNFRDDHLFRSRFILPEVWTRLLHLEVSLGNPLSGSILLQTGMCDTRIWSRFALICILHVLSMAILNTSKVTER